METLGKLFGSIARVKLLRAFFFNPEAAFTLEALATRTAVPAEKVRDELADLLDAEIIRKRGAGKEASYLLDKKYPHFEQLDLFIRGTTGAKNTDVKQLLRKAGAFKVIILSGFFTAASEASVDLLLVGDTITERPLARAVAALEAQFGREIRYTALTTADFRYRQGVYDRLIRDVLDYPHRVVVDSLGL